MTFSEIPYEPVALVCRLPDGQLVVLEGQAEMVETSVEFVDYTSTVTWRRMGRAFTQHRLTDAYGVQLRIDGDWFRVSPLLPLSDDPPDRID